MILAKWLVTLLTAFASDRALCDLASRRVRRYSIIDSLLTARVLKDPDAEAEFAPKESIRRV